MADRPYSQPHVTQSGPRLIGAWAEYALTIAARTLRAEMRGAFREMIGVVLRDHSRLWTGHTGQLFEEGTRMANDDHIAQHMNGPVAWNAWREENPEIYYPDRAHLSMANLSGANLSGANLSGADLRGANLETCTLVDTNFTTLISPAVASTAYPRGV